MMLAYAYTEGEIADFALQPQTQTCDVNNANAPCTLYNGSVAAQLARGIADCRVLLLAEPPCCPLTQHNCGRHGDVGE